LANFLREQLIPRLARCDDEIKNVLNGLSGQFVPPGPSGAPTRGRIDVLPTGRNFFTIDPRAVPTQTSWNCGKMLADRLLERYRQDQGEYPRKIALVIWGTSNMRTGGDDIAQALWLWGCEPVWEESSGRVVDFRILPLSLLGRPRVDLLLRVSGLFRDAFGDTLRLLATVPKRLAQQDEPPDMNPIRGSWLLERETLTGRGLDRDEASRRATLRVFSSGFGSYGTGLLPLIDAGNWDSAEDLTEVFCRWGSYAFDSDGTAEEDVSLLKTRLAEIEVVHHPPVGVDGGLAVGGQTDRVDAEDAGGIGRREILPERTLSRRRVEAGHSCRQSLGPRDVERFAVLAPPDRRFSWKKSAIGRAFPSSIEKTAAVPSGSLYWFSGEIDGPVTSLPSRSGTM